MVRAASLLPGRHDYAAFAAADPSKPGESTIVVVTNAELGVEDNLVLFRIEASHYLWKMVRRVVGVLVKVGKGEVSPVQGLDVAAWTAPASGLFLEVVEYKTAG